MIYYIGPMIKVYNKYIQERALLSSNRICRNCSRGDYNIGDFQYCPKCGMELLMEHTYFDRTILAINSDTILDILNNKSNFSNYKIDNYFDNKGETLKTKFNFEYEIEIYIPYKEINERYDKTNSHNYKTKYIYDYICWNSDCLIYSGYEENKIYLDFPDLSIKNIQNEINNFKDVFNNEIEILRNNYFDIEIIYSIRLLQE